MATESEALAALEQFEAELKSRRNVVGLGVTSESDDLADLNVAVAVYVDRKIPKSELSAVDILPKSLKVTLGSATVEVPVKVVAQGQVRLEKV
jgi:hypothetical protein